MDVYLLYFTLHGHDPNGFTSWGAILVEDDEIESFVGTEPTEFEALLDGLTRCLARIPSTLPIVIRSKHRSVLKLGKRWLETWRSDGWDTEVQVELISAFIDTLETRRVEWFSPSYLDHLDNTVMEYALEEWNLQQDEASINNTPEELDVDALDKRDKTSSEETTSGDACNPDDSIDVTTSPLNKSEFREASNCTDTVSNPQLNISSAGAMLIPQEEHSEAKPKSEQTADSTKLDTSSITEAHDVLMIDPDDKRRYPYVDDDGWRQLYTLFEPPFTQMEHRPPSRIVAYVAASHHQDLASWSFALIDKPSQMAFFKAVGHRHSTLNRALLQGCIALLSSLKSDSHHVECRLDNRDLTTLLRRLIADPSSVIEDDMWMMESAFVSQLSYWIEQRSITVEYIGGETSDLAIQMVQNFSRERLAAINYGEAPEFSLRRRRFPLNRLIN